MVQTIKKENEYKTPSKVTIIIVSCIMSLVIALSVPTEYYANATAITEIAGLVVAGLAGTATATVLASSVPVVVALLIGMGVSLTVQMITNAILASMESGAYWDFVDNLSNGHWSLVGPLFTAGAFTFTNAYNWVKEHIVNYFAEKTETTVTGGFNNFSGGLMGTYEFIDQDYQFGIYRKLGETVIYDDLGNKQVNEVFYCKPGSSGDEKIKFVSSQYDKSNTLIYSVSITNTWSDYQYRPPSTPYYIYYPNITENGTYSMKISRKLSDGKLYDISFNNPYITYKFDKLNNNEYFTMKHSDNNDIYCILNFKYYYFSLKIDDNTIKNKFDNPYQFIHYLPKAISINYTGTELNTGITGKTNTIGTNKYYNAKADTIKTTAENTAKAIEENPAITDENTSVKVNTKADAKVNVTDDTAINTITNTTDIAVDTSVENVDIKSLDLNTCLNISKNQFVDGIEGEMQDKFPFCIWTDIKNYILPKFNGNGARKLDSFAPLASSKNVSIYDRTAPIYNLNFTVPGLATSFKTKIDLSFYENSTLQAIVDLGICSALALELGFFGYKFFRSRMKV